MKTTLIETNEPPEVDAAEEVVHLPAGRLREPVVDAAEQRHQRARGDHVVEVADDVVGVVQVDVGRRQAQRQPGQPADAEHRQERQREQHRHGEADRPAVERDEQRRQDDDRRDRDDHRRRLEERAHRRPHAGQEHVVRPDDERHEAEEHHRVDQHAVAPDRLPRVVGDDLADYAQRRQDQDVHLGMGQEPEQVLPQQHAAAAASPPTARRHRPGRPAGRSWCRPRGPSTASRRRPRAAGRRAAGGTR